MNDLTYQVRREALGRYFDETASDNWAALTSDEPVSGIRAKVRAGRDQTAQQLLDWLPLDLQGARVLDAGCGTGVLATRMARRGADVVAVDLSPRLIEVARQRTPAELQGRLKFHSGDMCDASHGRFDYIVGMDSLIHYSAGVIEDLVADFADRAASGLLFTVVPSTLLFQVLHTVGRAFPKSDRAPDVRPQKIDRFVPRLARRLGSADWRLSGSTTIDAGFYKSHAMHWARD